MANRMTVTRVWGVYFSPTGTTRRIVRAIGAEAAAFFSAAMGKEVWFGTYDFTLPGKRMPDDGGEQAGTGEDTGRSATAERPGHGCADMNQPERSQRQLSVGVPAGERISGYATVPTEGKGGAGKGPMGEESRQLPVFSPGDVVILGVPVYAGRVPNLLLPFLRSIRGRGAWGIPVVLFGNRHFDDALAELKEMMEQGGFIPVAAAAFVGEHSFSSRIAAGRPDGTDMAAARQLGRAAVHKLERMAAAPCGPVIPALSVPGAPETERVYYRPGDAEGNKIDIRKVKPLTRSTCHACGICAAVCPMGAIDAAAPELVKGICIKCCACVRQCPVHAKYFEDPGYLYHVEDLEKKLTGREEPVIFV